MSAFIQHCQEMANGLGFILKLGWVLWARQFEFLPYGNPWVAAVAMGCLFVIIDHIVRPRNQSYG